MITAKKNPWLKVIENKKELEAQQSLLAEMSKKAKEILADQKFIEYKKMYDRYHEAEIENIMILKEDDPIKYAFKIRQIVDTLKAYRLLISSVEEDAHLVEVSQ